MSNKKDETRRSALKKMAVAAYAVPTTMALLTSRRAVAQSKGVDPPEPPGPEPEPQKVCITNSVKVTDLGIGHSRVKVKNGPSVDYTQTKYVKRNIGEFLTLNAFKQPNTAIAVAWYVGGSYVSTSHEIKIEVVAGLGGIEAKNA